MGYLHRHGLIFCLPPLVLAPPNAAVIWNAAFTERQAARGELPLPQCQWPCSSGRAGGQIPGLRLSAGDRQPLSRPRRAPAWTSSIAVLTTIVTPAPAHREGGRGQTRLRGLRVIATQRRGCASGSCLCSLAVTVLRTMAKPRS